MKLYHSSLDNGPKDTTFAHFGSLCAAARRIESKFSGPPYRAYCGNSRFVLVDTFGRPVGEQTLDDSLESFAEYASNHTIGLFSLDVKNPLPLNDLWGDDPIASGGIGIVDSDRITEAQHSRLCDLFQPFDGIIEPFTIMERLSVSQRQAAKRFCDTNSLARAQLSARKRRAKALGQDWRIVGSSECVWVQRTIEFRRWAILEGYDGFTYTNEAEGRGEQSVVCLHANQSIPMKRLVFHKDLYLSRTKPVFEEFIQSLASPGTPHRTDSGGFKLDVFWVGMEPENFWEAQP